MSCRLRCHSSLAQTLPPEEAPVDRPFWGVDDPGMPLPFDLADIINRVESLLWRCARDVQVWRFVFIYYRINSHRHLDTDVVKRSMHASRVDEELT